jgi:hypothetical protein
MTKIDRINSKNNSGRLVTSPFTPPDGAPQLGTDPAGTHESEDRRGTDIDFKTKHEIAQVVGQHLGKHSEPHSLKPVAPQDSSPSMGAGFGIFVHFGKQLSPMLPLYERPLPAWPVPGWSPG